MKTQDGARQTLTCVAVLVASSACGSDSHHAGPTTTTTTATDSAVEVAADGGAEVEASDTVETDVAQTTILSAQLVAGRFTVVNSGVTNGPLAGLRVTVPATAVEADMMITLSLDPATRPEALGPRVEILPHGTRFAAPIEIALPFAWPSPPLSPNATIGLARWADSNASEESLTHVLGVRVDASGMPTWIFPIALQEGPDDSGWELLGVVPNPVANTRYPYLLLARTPSLSILEPKLGSITDGGDEGTTPLLGCGSDGDCNDGRVCTTDACVGTAPNRVCEWTHPIDGTPCNDGDPATVQDTCIGSVCRGETSDCAFDAHCADTNACNLDWCDGGVCRHAPDYRRRPCDDGDPKTLLDFCVGGVCSGAVAECIEDEDCDDHETCTRDTCDLATCFYEPNNGAPCNDGDARTFDDTCWFGTCEGFAASCEMSRPDRVCPVPKDPCNPMVCLAFSPPHGYCEVSWTGTADLPCDDGDATTIDDRCWAGRCRGHRPGTCSCARATLTATDCAWSDATQCSGLKSAYCTALCNQPSGECFDACERTFDNHGDPAFEEGQVVGAPGCLITVHCN